MKNIVLFLIFFGFVGPVDASTIEIQRTDGSMIRFYFEKPAATNFPILIVLEGSTCTSTWPLVQMVSSVLGKKIGVVGIEKYGLSESTKECPQSYVDNNSIDQRIEDHLEVLTYLRANESGWNKSLGWAGGSEGGKVASLVAPLVPETKALVMLASGGGLTMADELPISTARSLRRTDATPEAIQKALDDLQIHFQLIRNNPTSKLEWLSDGQAARNTFKWWDSILWKKALPLLEMVDFPIYIAHGTEDTSCPIESSEELVARFQSLGKQNLIFKRYPGLEHDWSDLDGKNHSQQVLGDAFTWVFKNLN